MPEKGRPVLHLPPQILADFGSEKQNFELKKHEQLSTANHCFQSPRVTLAILQQALGIWLWILVGSAKPLSIQIFYLSMRFEIKIK